jgi:hypothetical protein
MMQKLVGAAALLFVAALLAGCGGSIYDSVPAAANDDTVAAETMADDPMEPGAIDESLGTQVP